MNLSRIISGTMNWGSWGSNYSSKEISELIKCAYENGIHSFDHADIYGGYTTEEAFGKAFKLSGIEREKVIFISKCGIMYPCEKLQIDVKHYDYSKSHIIKSVEKTRRLERKLARPAVVRKERREQNIHLVGQRPLHVEQKAKEKSGERRNENYKVTTKTNHQRGG